MIILVFIGTKVQHHDPSADVLYTNIGEQMKPGADKAVKDLELRYAND